MGDLESPGHRLGGLGAPGNEPLFKVIGFGRLDEDRHGLRVPVENRQCTLDIDLQHHPIAGRQTGSDFAGQRAVPVLPAVDPATFEEIPPIPPTIELGLGEEVVVDPVPFAGPRGAGRGRDARNELWQTGEESAQDRRLTDPGGARDDDDIARAGLFWANHRSVVAYDGAG